MNFNKFDTEQNTNTELNNAGSNETVVGIESNVSLVKSDHSKAIENANTSILNQRDTLKLELINSGEAKRISDTLSVTNPQSVIDFGKEVSEKIGSCADEILKRQSINTVSQAGEMMAILTKIMDKVDINELDEPLKKPSFLEKIFDKAQSKIEALISKYNNIGTEIEKVCVELKTYEYEIERSNSDLENLYDGGIKAYKELVKYVIAGEMALDEVNVYKSNLAVKAESDEQAALELSNIEQIEQLLAQRVQDLRMAESVALQSLPIVKAMQFGNLNLARKINSAFIVTIPVFKNAMAQAILAKRQYIQAKALKALDDKTNEMLLKNAKNAANNMRMTAQLAGSSAIKVETIQQSWQTIMDGIRDTKAIQEELKKQREADKKQVEEINNKFLNQFKCGGI